MRYPVIRLRTKGGWSQKSAAAPESQTAVWGPPLWRELHRRPWECPDPAADGPWLADFARRVPCAICQGHWLRLVAEYPPDLSSRDNYFVWTVAQHNRVNASLGKPEYPVFEAYRLFAPPGGGVS